MRGASIVSPTSGRAASCQNSFVRGAPMVSCRDCGALVPDISGPTHVYVPSAPGCWAACGQVQADALIRIGSPRRHGTVVDCYMAQHPGDGYERRSRQSPIVHLVAFSLLIEHGIDGKGTFVRMSRLLARERTSSHSHHAPSWVG